MSSVERQQALLEVLRRRRFDTYANLAFEFGVSTRTIQRDIQILMCSYPIETVRGRYGGGVRAMTDLSLEGSSSKRTLNAEQTELLVRIRKSLSGSDIDTLDSILSQFAP